MTAGSATAARRRLRDAVGARLAVLAVAAAALSAAGLQPTALAQSAGDEHWQTFVEDQGDKKWFGDRNSSNLQFYYEVDPALEMEISGEFPRLRYFSLIAYDEKNRPISVFHDYQIEPEPGHTNPFRPGNDWNASRRSYSIEVRFDAPPAGGAAEPNVMYLGEQADGSPNHGGRIDYRRYLPSEGYDFKGGVPLPRLVLRRLSDGRTVEAPDLRIRDVFDMRFLLRSIREARQRSEEEGVVKTATGGVFHWQRSAQIAFLGENPGTAYIVSDVEPRRDRLLHVRWKAPTFPPTYRNRGVTGGSDVRYWSLSFGSRERKGETLLSLADHQVATDDEGYANLVVSFGPERPAWVEADAGYTWVDLRGEPASFLIYRNILPADSFPYSAFAVDSGEPVEHEMGEYLPQGTWIAAGAAPAPGLDQAAAPSGGEVETAAAPAAGSAYAPTDPAPGALAVTSTTVELEDPTRDKTLPLRITYPTDSGPVPVIVFSHGAFGSRDDYRKLVRFWASHGYVCIQPNHADSRDFMAAGDGAGRLRRVGGGETPGWENRVKDVTFVLDSLARLARLVPELDGKLDISRIGVGGHSYGAQTAQLVGGVAAFEPQSGRRLDLADPRPDAILLISPQGRGEIFTRESWDSFRLPAMIVTGSNDDSRRTGNTYEWRMEPYEFAPGGDKYLAFIEGAYHGFGGIVGVSAERMLGPPNERHVKFVLSVTTAFWNAYLRGDDDARKVLRSDTMAEATGEALAVDAR